MEATLLVHGLREESADDADTEDRLWRRTSDALLSRWPSPSPLPGTVCAEQGLGILGSPYYFYVMRAHRAFGYMVFIFEEAQTSASMPSDTKGATPFDTGGLWIGAIHPVNDRGEKRRLFANEEVALDCWRSEFLRYIDRNYSDAKHYVVGDPPKFGIDGITARTPENEARAWTWEVRYPSELAPSWLRLERAYMHRDDHTDYLDWLPHSDYEDEKIDEIATVVQSRVEIHEGETTMASGRAQAGLLELI